jgi:hypothetical protein
MPSFATVSETGRPPGRRWWPEEQARGSAPTSRPVDAFSLLRQSSYDGMGAGRRRFVARELRQQRTRAAPAVAPTKWQEEICVRANWACRTPAGLGPTFSLTSIVAPRPPALPLNTRAKAAKHQSTTIPATKEKVNYAYK